MADRPRSIKRQLSGQTRKPKRLDHQAHGIRTTGQCFLLFQPMLLVVCQSMLLCCVHFSAVFPLTLSLLLALSATGSPLEAMAEEDETTTDEPEEEDVPSSADSDDEPPARMTLLWAEAGVFFISKTPLPGPIPPMLRNRSISNPRMNLRPYVPPVDEFEEDGDEGEMSVDSEEEDLVAAMRTPSSSFLFLVE